MPDNPHLADPALAPFLADDFSPEAYLNATLPPLLPPSSLSPARPESSVPLSSLSTQTTNLLSTLDYNTQRLLTTLTTLTDEILRLTPRLNYSVDLLRTDVVSLGEELQCHAVAAVAGAGDKPAGMDRLEMLATVRDRVTEVIRIFGDAIQWSIADGVKKGDADPIGNVLFLVASGDLEGAQKKVAALKLLAGVFEGTVEGPARIAVVEAVEERVKAAVEKAETASCKVVEKAPPPPPQANVTEAKSGEGGYYGLIEQLRGLRGM